jgi:Abnormal spindle-like microcephaly-assoc'd, ASPM-SPD-2-Hydin/Cep192 domain 4/HYDIN/CFA65/VesB-like, Ig-like domain
MLGRRILKLLCSSASKKSSWSALLVVAGLIGLAGCQGLGGKAQDQGPGVLTPSPSSLSFGNVQTGTSQTKSDTVTNTGQSSLTISQITVTGAGFSISGITAPVTLAAGDSATFTVQFGPTSDGAVSGNVAFATDNGTVNLPLSGDGVEAGDVTASPSSINFGSVVIGSAASQTVTLKNTGGANVTITAAAVSGTGFSDSGLTLPLTLTPNQTSTFSVSFAPTITGTVNGNVALTVTGEPELEIPLAGTGLAPATLTASPTSLTFTNIVVGQNSTQTETIKNTGGASAQITAVTATGTGFSVSGITLPATLGAGQSVTFNVTFAPQAAGSFNGNVAVTSNAQNPTLNIPVSGTAVAAGNLTASPTSINFGNVVIGSSASQTVTLKNTGGANVTVTAASISGTGFSFNGLTLPLTLTPNQTSGFNVKFTPASAGVVNGTMSLTVTGSANVGIPLTGDGLTPATLTANPTSLTFTNIVVGKSSTQTETIKNTGGTSAQITGVAATGTGFSVSGITLPVSLGAGQSVSFNVTFTPPAAGSFSGNVAVTSNAQNPTLNIPVSGTAISAQGTLSVTSPINVGNVVVGTGGTATGTLTASSATVMVSSVSVTGANATEFSVTGLTFPVTVNVGSPVSFIVNFTPTVTGAASATASFVSNASNSPTSSSLTGTGTAAPVHSVQLTWIASATGDVTSYNVYRAVFSSSCGTYSNIGATVAPTTTFTDNNVTDGTTYCYATTAVDPSGESVYSNIAQAQIPAP